MKSLTTVILFLFLLSCILFQGCTEYELDYRHEMRDFVCHISSYAHQIHPDFIIIPQNGIELITITGVSDGNLSECYLQAIDGVGQESLLYGYEEDNTITPKEEQDWLHGFLDIITKQGKQVLVTDYCWTKEYINHSYGTHHQHGYISFAADHRGLDTIPSYPPYPFKETDEDIFSVSDAHNFLYLIDPFSYTSKEAFLHSISQTNYDILIIDLFYQNQFTKDDLVRIQTKANGGRRLVLCYMSIGEAEDYRYYWNQSWYTHPPSWLDEENPSWPGNYKVQYWNETWQQIIYGTNESYLDIILHAGFDGVYLDIIDAYEYFENKRII